ncbi:MAG TPA: tetratricopeptide repeat protein [Candidatus Binatia bacterium]|nr:tetratricopeptide repeat protein [Candidatus Binatia bacterium]
MPAETPRPPHSRPPVDLLVALALAAVTLIVFSPALGNGWVDYDDDRNFLTNPGYRGLGVAQLSWMLTGAIMGHWTPVTWLSHGVDYAVWGMNPLGYHLGNLLLHAGNVALVWALALRLLGAAQPAAEPMARRLGAGVTALLFGLHPLRAESVAWITERRDVLAALFFLLALLAWLRFAGERRRGLYLASLGLFTLGLLSKSMVVSLPLVLLILDVYPLRRLDVRAWRAPAARAVLLEKVPYLVLALATVAITSAMMASTVRVTSLALYGPAARVAMAAYSLAFYPWKTVAPLDLMPMYELPMRVSLLQARFLVPALAVAVVSVALVLGRRRWPAGLAAWLAYAVMLAPVSGLVHAGPQLVADRFSYLPSLAPALLVGAGVMAAMRQALLGRVVLIALGVWLVSMAALTWAQVQAWRDTDTLYAYALDIEPDCAWCHAQYGGALGNRGDLAGAIPHLQRAVALRPHRAGYQANAGLALLEAHRAADAVPYLERAVAAQPQNMDATANLGLALLEVGHAADALPYLERAAAARPDAPEPRRGLARAYRTLGRETEAARALARP